jgi:glutathione synthase/RimK-type ligase-like ATP-grasp enzyme
VAIATCAAVADLDADGVALANALADEGADARPAVWDDDRVRWADYDVVCVRSTWDYAERHAAFLEWAAHAAEASTLVNPLPVIRWNTTKTYLADLASVGVAVAPTTFVRPGERAALPAAGEYVVKPAVSAGARDTARYGPGDDDRARAHVRRLLDAGRTAMLQPYVPSVDTYGETGLVYAGGVFSHAFRKGPLLVAGATPTEGLYAAEDISPRTPTRDERAVACEAVGAAQERFGLLAYARVDLVMTADGPLVLELELTEPSLFLDASGADPVPFARAILDRVGTV